MKQFGSFLFLFILCFKSQAVDCFIEKKEILLSDKVSYKVQNLYKESKFLGIAVTDHEQFSGFNVLKKILEDNGMDPLLKTVVVEDSAIFADLYFKMSTQEPSHFIDELEMIPKTAQFNFIYDQIFPLVRWLNKQRPLDPIIVVPIDSMDNSSGMMPMYYGGEVIRSPESASLFLDTTQYQFVMSINREKLTANNFKSMVFEKFSGRKSIIVYHAAHILDNLGAYGYELIGKSTHVKFDFLGWSGFFSSENEIFSQNFKKIFMDVPSIQNPSASVCWPKELTDHISEKGGWASVENIDFIQFNPDSFLRRYREGTVSIMDKNIADLYLLNKEIK